jgi:hypothetical protein
VNAKTKARWGGIVRPSNQFRNGLVSFAGICQQSTFWTGSNLFLRFIIYSDARITGWPCGSRSPGRVRLIWTYARHPLCHAKPEDSPVN